jgi:predicted nucleic acid-binding protein
MITCSPVRRPAKAILIVTRDRDLLDLGTFRDIRILAAHDALQLIDSAKR